MVGRVQVRTITNDDGNKPGAGALRRRRRQGRTGSRRPDRGDLHGRVRAVEPAAGPGQTVGAAKPPARASSAPRRRRRRATYQRPHGLRHLLTSYDLSRDKLYGHVTTRNGRTEFLAFCRYLRSLHPAEVRIAIGCDNVSPHLSTKTDTRVGDWAAANNVELPYVAFYGSWLNRIEAQFTALRYFALDGTDHTSHAEQASMIRRYIAWRNRHAHDQRLRQVVTEASTVKRAEVARCGTRWTAGSRRTRGPRCSRRSRRPPRRSARRTRHP